MNEDANRRELGRAVKAARLRKFRTLDRARIAAGIARGTWEKVERGDIVQDYSLTAVEEALDWQPGQAQAILGGDTAPAAAPATEPEPDMGEQMRQILENQRQLEQRLAALERETEAG